MLLPRNFNFFRKRKPSVGKRTSFTVFVLNSYSKDFLLVSRLPNSFSKTYFRTGVFFFWFLGGKWKQLLQKKKKKSWSCSCNKKLINQNKTLLILSLLQKHGKPENLTGQIECEISENCRCCFTRSDFQTPFKSKEGCVKWVHDSFHSLIVSDSIYDNNELFWCVVGYWTGTEKYQRWRSTYWILVA